MDTVVYHPTRKSPLIPPKWHPFYVIEVTIGQNISKIKNTLLPHHEHLFESLVVMHITRKPSKMLQDGTTFMLFCPVMTKL